MMGSEKEKRKGKIFKEGAGEVGLANQSELLTSDDKEVAAVRKETGSLMLAGIHTRNQNNESKI